MVLTGTKRVAAAVAARFEYVCGGQAQTKARARGGSGTGVRERVICLLYYYCCCNARKQVEKSWRKQETHYVHVLTAVRTDNEGLLKSKNSRVKSRDSTMISHGHWLVSNVFTCMIER